MRDTNFWLWPRDAAAYRAAATPAALELAGVGAEAALSKARMSALLALCSRAGTDEVGLGKCEKCEIMVHCARGQGLTTLVNGVGWGGGRS